MADQETPVTSPPAPVARRFTRQALALIAALVILLLMTVAMLVSTPPETKSKFQESKEKPVAANPTLFNSLPRTPIAPQRTPQELLDDAIRRQVARTPPPPRTARFPDVPQPGDPGGSVDPNLPSSSSAGSATAAVAEGGVEAGVGGVDGQPPLGAYRPFTRHSYTYPQATSAGAALAAPSYVASFASSLLGGSSPSTAAATPTRTSSGLDSQLPPSLSLPAVLQSAGFGAPPPTTTPAKADPDRSLVRPSRAPAVRRVVRAGTVLRTILLTSVSTQLPGDAVAHLLDDVYGSDGSLVLPKGTRLIGSYANRVPLGDNRLELAWDRVQLPNGPSFKVPGLPSTSSDGATGIPGAVNNHTGLVFGRAALLSLISAGTQLGQPRQSRLGATLSSGELVAGSASQQFSQAGTAYLNRAIDVAPTLTVPAGTELTVLVPYDLDLK